MRPPSRLPGVAALILSVLSMVVLPTRSWAEDAAPVGPVRVRVITSSDGAIAPSGMSGTSRTLVAQQRAGEATDRVGNDTTGTGGSSTAAPVSSEGRDEVSGGGGIVVRRFPGGYMSYVRDEPPGGPGEAPDASRQGGVILVPASEAPGLSMRPSESSREGTERERPRRRALRESRESEGDGAAARPEWPKERCQHERGRLAQRLLELRGIQVGPSEALLVLEESEQPLSGHVRRSMFGLESAGVGGTLLATGVSFDSETRDRLAALVRCLER